MPQVALDLLFDQVVAFYVVYILTILVLKALLFNLTTRRLLALARNVSTLRLALYLRQLSRG